MLIPSVFHLLTLTLNLLEYTVLDQGSSPHSCIRTIPLPKTPHSDKPNIPLSLTYYQVLTTMCDNRFVVLLFQSHQAYYACRIQTQNFETLFL